MARGRRVNASGDGIRVTGLTELNRALRQVDPVLQKELKAANLEVAQDVTLAAKGKAAGLGSTAAKVAPSISAAARNVAAGVSFGGAAYPFAEGAEFGAVQYAQFQPFRGSGPDAGYFVYPAIRDKAGDIEASYLDALDTMIRKAGLEQ